MVLQVLYIYRTMLAGTKKITMIQVLLSMEQDDLARNVPIDIAVQMRGSASEREPQSTLEALSALPQPAPVLKISLSSRVSLLSLICA